MTKTPFHPDFDVKFQKLIARSMSRAWDYGFKSPYIKKLPRQSDLGGWFVIAWSHLDTDGLYRLWQDDPIKLALNPDEMSKYILNPIEMFEKVLFTSNNLKNIQ